jgi:hypothetical protein
VRYHDRGLGRPESDKNYKAAVSIKNSRPLRVKGMMDTYKTEYRRRRRQSASARIREGPGKRLWGTSVRAWNDKSSEERTDLHTATLLSWWERSTLPVQIL